MELGLSNILIDAAIVVAVVAVIVLLVVARPRRKEPRVLSLAEVQEGVCRTGIVTIEGRETGSGVYVYIRSRGGGLVRVQTGQGTVLEATDPERQSLIAPRPQALEVPPRSTQRLELETLSLDARKLPPGRRGEGDYRVRGLTEDDEILRLLHALDTLEAEIARHVRQADGDGVTYRPMSDDLTILATYCTSTALVGGHQIRVQAEVIQYALWQIRDKLSFDEIVGLVVHPASPEGRVKLVGKVLAANILLEAAGVKPTADM